MRYGVTPDGRMMFLIYTARASIHVRRTLRVVVLDTCFPGPQKYFFKKNQIRLEMFGHHVTCLGPRLQCLPTCTARPSTVACFISMALQVLLCKRSGLVLSEPICVQVLASFLAGQHSKLYPDSFKMLACVAALIS